MEPSKSKAFAVLLAVFLGGLITGALCMRVYNQQIAQAVNKSTQVDFQAQPGVVAKHLRDKLTLSDGQMAQVEDILDDCIMREADLLMQTKQIRVEARQRILGLLDNDQRKKFETVVDEVSTQ